MLDKQIEPVLTYHIKGITARKANAFGPRLRLSQHEGSILIRKQ